MPVNTQCEKYKNSLNRWKVVRDCIEGQTAIVSGREKYLPKLAGQSDDEYSAYQKRAVFFDATSRTAEGLHGHIFARDPIQTGEVSDQFKSRLDDVDAAGTGLDQFASNTAWDAMQTGWGGILVDHVPVPKDTPLPDVKGGAFLKWYEAESIINWRYSVIDGKSCLSLVVLREDCANRNTDDEFVTDSIEGYRVLSLDENGNYIQRVFRESKNSKDGFVQIGETKTPKIKGKALKRIPFFTCPGETPEKSMLLGLAYENIGHFQKTADYENGLHYTGVPTPIVENMKAPKDEENIKLGGSTFLFFFDETSADVRVKYLEFTGSGLAQLLQALNACLDRMAKLGIQAIGSEKKGVETAEVAQIHRASENGVLGAFARNLSDKITRAVRVMAQWNLAAEDGAGGWSYELNNNFNYAELSAQMLAIMHSARQSNEIPRSVWYNTLKQNGKIPENMAFEDFLEEIENGMVSGHGPDGEAEP